MDWLQILILSLVQGVTEFLPISSSAHLILTPHLFGWGDQGLAFDVAVHLGTLVAVVVYFNKQLRVMFLSCIKTLAGNGIDAESRLAGYVIWSTFPVVLVGAFFHDEIANHLRSPLVIAMATIVFGLALLLANRVKSDAVSEYALNMRIALVIGLAQVLALVPGTSRSGITMMAGVMMGMTQAAAARFSFLLAIPVITGSAVYESINLLRQPEKIDWGVLFFGAILAGLSALICIHLFLRLIEKTGFLPFVIYRLLLGIVLLILFM